MPYQFSTSAHINAPEHISELQEKLNILAAAKRSFMRNFTQLTHTMRRTLLNVYITHLRKYLTFLFSSIRSQICLTLNSFSSLISWPRILSKICESLHQDKWVALKIIANRVHNYLNRKGCNVIIPQMDFLSKCFSQPEFRSGEALFHMFSDQVRNQIHIWNTMAALDVAAGMRFCVKSPVMCSKKIFLCLIAMISESRLLETRDNNSQYFNVKTDGKNTLYNLQLSNGQNQSRLTLYSQGYSFN